MKRIRRNGVKQSKYGCRTCKQRKIKCDEHFPICGQCARGRRACNDWPTRPGASRLTLQTGRRPSIPLTPQTATSSSPCTVTALAVSPAGWHDALGLALGPRSLSAMSEEDGLLTRAWQIVQSGHPDDASWFNRVLHGALFRHDRLRKSTKWAVAALEAAFEHSNCNSNNSEPFYRAALAGQTYAMYARAVPLYYLELSTGADNDWHSSTLATCLLLMCTERLLRRRQDAMVHLAALNGIYTKLLTKRMPQAGADIDAFLRCLDIQKMASSDTVVHGNMAPVHIRRLASPPDVDVDVDAGVGVGADADADAVAALDRHVIALVHAGHCFITKAALGVSHGQPVAAFESERSLHLSALFQTYGLISRLLGRAVLDQNIAPLLRLQTTCLAMHIELSNILETSEGSYDKFSQQFEAIIINADRILALRPASTQPGVSDFSLQLGTVQPLYLAAMKYRHRTWRRRAISCLLRAGQEGPWRGPLLAAVAQRVADLEEAHSPPQVVSRGLPTSYQSDALAVYQDHHSAHVVQEPSSVPNTGRITACRFTEDSSVRDFDWHRDPAFTNSPVSITMTEVTFLRRYHDFVALPGRVLSCFKPVNNVDSEGLSVDVLNPLDWHTWSEKIAF